MGEMQGRWEPVESTYCGDGRGRTAVQTKHQRAFYTLILPLIVGERLPAGGPMIPYLLNLGAL